MNIVIFDTETTSLDKPFCYNIGYIIVNTEDWENLIERSFVVTQIWHNLPLFNTAYYAEKRPIYVNAMRSRKCVMDKFGYICQTMIKDFRRYNVEMAFAFNSSFDEKVFNFNCDWYKCNNPFDTIPIKDIRGFAHNFLVDENYYRFCEKNSLFTDTGNYSTTAENLFKYISGFEDFEEAHTALEDSKIETVILMECVVNGAKLSENYKAKRSIERNTKRTLHIKTAEQTDYYFDYEKIRINKERTEIKLT